MFIYTDVIQNSEIQVEMNYAKVFAIFGFNKLSQIIQHSTINVSLNFEVIQAALICIQCDLQVLQSTLIFKATGQILSGIMLQSKDTLDLQLCNLQLRFNSTKSSGLVNQILVAMTEFSLVYLKLSADIKQNSSENGYFASSVNISNTVITQKTQICVESHTPRVGNGNPLLSASTETISCMGICDQGKYVYGFCLQNLVLGQYQSSNDSFICVLPFIYNGEYCECSQGYLLNSTSCINIIDQLSSIDQWLSGNVSILSNITAQNVEFTNQLNIIEGYIVRNVSDLQQLIQLQSNALETHLIGNISSLNDKTNSQLTSIKQLMQDDKVKLFQQINLIGQQLDQRIQENEFTFNSRIQALNQSLITNTNDLTSNISSLNSTISNISTQIAASLITINDNFTNLNQNLINNMSEVNKSVFGLANVTSANITQLNSQMNNISEYLKTHVQSLNVAVLTINTTLSENVSQISETLQKLNTSILSNISAVNQSIQFINMSLLSNIQSVNFSMVQTTSSILTNISIINTTLSNQINASNIKINQLSNSILDLQKQIVDINVAELEPHLEFSEDFSNDLVCMQTPFIYQFDIVAITNSVNQANFTGDYVFGNVLAINNAFIDVADDSLSISVFYLFQTQSYYYNLKIQVGTQMVGSGSIVANSGIYVINKMQIISKIGSTLLILSPYKLNILERSANNLNIRNLVVSLTLENGSHSAGSVELVEIATGVLNIRNYQILGVYYSTQSSCMGALLTNNGQISMRSVNFNPELFTVGNASSYLFCQVNYSTLSLQRIVIQLGTSELNPNTITLISTTATKQLIFGGIIANTNNSLVELKMSVFSIITCYNTSFISFTGQIFGRLNSTSVVSVSQICFNDSSIFKVSNEVVVSAIAIVDGNLTFSKSSIVFNIKGDANYQRIGTIAYMTNLCVKSIISDLDVQIAISQKSMLNDDINVSALVARQCGQNWSVLNSQFISIDLTRGQQLGILSGSCENSIGLIMNVKVENSSITSTDYTKTSSGGFIGNTFQSKINVYSTNVYNFTSKSFGVDYCGAGIIFGVIQRSSVQSNNLGIQFSTILAGASNIAARAGTIGFIHLSQIIIESTRITNCNTTVNGTQGAEVYIGQLAGYLDSKCKAEINDMKVEQLVVNSNSGGSLFASSGIGGMKLNNEVNFLKTSLSNVSMVMQSATGSIFCASVISIILNSSVNFDRLNTFGIQIQGDGSANCYAGSIVSHIGFSSILIRNYQAIQLKLELNAQIGNISIGAVGYVRNSNVTLQECSIQQLNSSSASQNFNMVGGYIGTILSSSLTQTNSILFNSTITAFSNAEANLGGFLGLCYLQSNVIYINCSVDHIQLNSTAMGGSRSVLFIGRVENSIFSIHLLYITNSIAFTSANMSRSGGLFGRIYYSRANITQIILNNLNISSESKNADSYATGITTSLGWSEFNIHQSKISNLNLTAISQYNNVVAGALHATTDVSNISVVDTHIDRINVNAIVLNDSNSISVGMITCVLSTPEPVLFNLIHLNIGSINVTYSNSKYYFIGLISGYNDLKSIFFIQDSKSEGLYTIQGIQYDNCDQLKYYVNGDGNQYITRKGC
ncbi:Hypothetical_protein [Hexamita inflata]|uniref:Hypothetical_protein n=1 Tax=Hexamita inflata TaxID=28002 RepID=A0AA86PJJ2_9EUKA|nr:Hypothetical protein HINF_LOCUS28580 [Hexamita inflata]